MAPTKKRSRCLFVSGKWLFNERKNRECKPSPLVGEGGGGAVGRGKRENKQKNRNSVSKTLKDSFNLCTHTYPYRLAKLGTSLRVRGKLTLRKKEIIVFKIYYLIVAIKQ